MKLLGEKIHAQVSVLARLCRGGDANDLARAALEDKKVANANVMARNSDGARIPSTASTAAFYIADIFAWTRVVDARTTLAFHNHFLAVGVMVMMVERVQDAIGGVLDAGTDRGVVAPRVVVVAHVVAFFGGRIDGRAFGVDVYFFLRTSTGVLDVVGGLSAATVVALGNVDFGLFKSGSASRNLDVDVCLDAVIAVTKAVTRISTEGFTNMVSLSLPICNLGYRHSRENSAKADESEVQSHKKTAQAIHRLILSKLNRH